MPQSKDYLAVTGSRVAFKSALQLRRLRLILQIRWAYASNQCVAAVNTIPSHARCTRIWSTDGGALCDVDLMRLLQTSSLQHLPL